MLCLARSVGTAFVAIMRPGHGRAGHTSSYTVSHPSRGQPGASVGCYGSTDLFPHMIHLRRLGHVLGRDDALKCKTMSL